MPATPAGRRDQWIELLEPAPTRDDHGGEETGWSSLGRVKALVRHGSSAERREAAQDSAAQSATFRIPSNGTTRTMTPRHAVLFLGSTWNVTNVVLLRFDIEITAIRKAV